MNHTFNLKLLNSAFKYKILLAILLLSMAVYAVPEKFNGMQLSWLGDKAPVLPCGVSFGVPWERSQVQPNTAIVVCDSSGKAIPTQSWPLAYWPDGSVKWTGIAIGADHKMRHLSVVAGKVKSPLPATAVVVVTESNQTIEVHTDKLSAIIPKSGSELIQSLKMNDREIARNGYLIVTREDRSELENKKTIRQVDYTSKIEKVTVEQNGPVRAVIRIEGRHKDEVGKREWLPFVVRLYFSTGTNSIRLVHTFIFDGDQNTDFIKSIGITFAVPFREELQNRHIRFSTATNNIFSEPVRMIPGYKRGSMNNAVGYEQAQFDGKRVPNLHEFTNNEQENLLGTPMWDCFKINQLSADAWEISKRTNQQSSWLHAVSGNRARGLAFLGDVSGGLVIGMKRFWQKYPAGLEISDASKPVGKLTAWFWSPDAQSMDMRHYDTVSHSSFVTYEDDRTIPLKRAEANGCANTTELTLWATSDTPSPTDLNAMSDLANQPPLLICKPTHYHDTKTLGMWSLPNDSTPGLSANDLNNVEVQLGRAFDFYSGEVERRRWYGFWDFGDFRRTYDPIRHQWMYDIGGHGWNATELMPNVWLWFAFLRSGNADIFHLAEDMTRNTSEVDVYHLGRFAGVGTRHGVTHWGDGAKEPRISEAYIKRFYYYLTTDERTGDLIREPIALLDKTMMMLEGGKNNSKGSLIPIRIGPDWQAFASNWMTEWERTGDTKYRDYCLTGMKDLGKMSLKEIIGNSFYYDTISKHLIPTGKSNTHTQFLFLFAGDQIFNELSQLIPCPEFSKNWGKWCAEIIENNRSNEYFRSRLTAFVANFTQNKEMRDKAVNQYRELMKFGDDAYFTNYPVKLDNVTVSQPTVENPNKCTFLQAMATPEVSQWAINLMTIPELLKSFRENKLSNK